MIPEAELATLLTSGVTEQLETLCNLAIQGPPEAVDTSAKFAKVPKSEGLSFKVRRLKGAFLKCAVYIKG